MTATTDQVLVEYLRRLRSAAVYNVARRTPVDFASGLSHRLGASVWVKREDQQTTFSFKVRGAYNRMAKADPTRLSAGVIAASAGNHAQGVALGARRLGVSALIVAPTTTPSVKFDAIRSLGAEVVQHGETYDAAFERSKEIEAETGRLFVHPFDDPDVIAGQGTVGVEIVEDGPPNLDAVFVPVGGGGLLSGVAVAIRALSPTTRVFGVEPVDSAGMHASLAAGRRVRLDHVGLFADGVAVRQVGEEPFRLCRDYCDGVVLVENDDVCSAIKDAFQDLRAVLEPSGALALAGLRRFVERSGASDGRFLAVASGANLNFDRLRHISERAEIGEGRERLFAALIPERPGAFRRLVAAFGDRSITEFNYRYGDPDVAHVFVGVEARGDGGEVAASLAEAGFEAHDLTDDELAKTHLRHVVGGRTPSLANERFLHVDFPERPGALRRFLDALGGRWNITFFHYRNHGSDRGRVLAGIQLPAAERADFQSRLDSLGYPFTDVTDQPSLRFFL